MGVPVAGGFGGKEFEKKDPRDERFRSSAWIKTPESSILIDISPEFRLQSLRARLSHIDLLLVTHEHMDHIAGLDDLRPFNYVQEQSIPLYTTRTCREAIRSRFDYMFGPDRYPGSVSVDMKILEKTTQFRDCQITPLPVKHGSLDILGFRINDLVYMTDVKTIPDATREKIKGANVMVISGLRWEPTHPTHMTIPEAIEVARELEIPRTYLIHMNSKVNHEETSRKLPEGVSLSYDGLKVEV
jgi:phosphoribosyl 1,2-cyclic phosphate phosphodiesterase